MRDARLLLLNTSTYEGHNLRIFRHPSSSLDRRKHVLRYYCHPPHFTYFAVVLVLVTYPPPLYRPIISILTPIFEYSLTFNAQPNRRDNEAFTSRRNAAARERGGTGTVCQINNGETDLAAKFHKSLPHDDLGQVCVSFTPSANHVSWCKSSVQTV